MTKFKIAGGIGNKSVTHWTNPVCGHKQEFDYTSSAMCQSASCTEKNLPISKLIGRYNQDNRVKHFVDGHLE